MENALNTGENCDCTSTKTDIEILSTLTDICIKTGNHKDAEIYNNKLYNSVIEEIGKKTEDEYHATITSYKLSQIEDELKIEQMENVVSALAIESLNQKNEHTKFRFAAYVFVSLLLLCLSILAVFKIRSDARKKAKQKELTNKLLKLELEYNTDRLNRSVLSLSRKAEFTKDLMSKISGFKNLNQTEINEIKFYVMNEIDIDQSVLDSNQTDNELGTDYITQLKHKFPKLTPADIQLLGYIKMELSNKQIAELKNIATQSVKIAKNRLRKKLNIAPGSDIKHSLETITAKSRSVNPMLPSVYPGTKEGGFTFASNFINNYNRH